MRLAGVKLIRGNTTKKACNRVEIRKNSYRGVGFSPTRANGPDHYYYYGAAVTVILSAPAVPVATFPDDALIVAVPVSEPAKKITRTCPPLSVSADAGSIVPNVVITTTCVPS